MVNPIKSQHELSWKVKVKKAECIKDYLKTMLLRYFEVICLLDVLYTILGFILYAMFDYWKNMREIKRINRAHHVAMYMEIREGLRILSGIRWDPQTLVQIPKFSHAAWDAAKVAGVIPLHLKIQRVYLGFMLLNEKVKQPYKQASTME